ncbi:MAG: bifunctional heptose 7-phosphate kinase/heptose 1-phosphate adenyltransferase [Citricoccus sp.]|nr:bifunctional heptose 7-phosphate kinase/heptose 1-phosphate adenyltransferase [Citricoccus sp. WCRC_4]
MSTRIVVVGDVLLDRDVTGNSERLSPDAPVPVVDVEHVHASPGGAGLAALLCAGRAGGMPGPAPAVTLVAPLAEDAAAAELRAALDGIRIHALGHEGGTRTKTRIRSAGQTLVRVDEGGPGTPRDVDATRLAEVLDSADVVLVSTTGEGSPGTMPSGLSWRAWPSGCRWCGIRIRAAASRWPGAPWSPRTWPRPAPRWPR